MDMYTACVGRAHTHIQYTRRKSDTSTQEHHRTRHSCEDTRASETVRTRHTDEHAHGRDHRTRHTDTHAHGQSHRTGHRHKHAQARDHGCRRTQTSGSTASAHARANESIPLPALRKLFEYMHSQEKVSILELRRLLTSELSAAATAARTSMDSTQRPDGEGPDIHPSHSSPGSRKPLASDAEGLWETLQHVLPTLPASGAPEVEIAIHVPAYVHYHKRVCARCKQWRGNALDESCHAEYIRRGLLYGFKFPWRDGDTPPRHIMKDYPTRTRADAKVLAKDFDDLIARGITEPVSAEQVKVVSPRFTVYRHEAPSNATAAEKELFVKTAGRAVLDASKSGVNAHLDSVAYAYTNLDRLVRLAHAGDCGFKIDLSKYYHQLPNWPGDRKYCGISQRRNGGRVEFARYKRLALGLRHAPAIASLVSASIAAILEGCVEEIRSIGVYLDDFYGLAKSEEDAHVAVTKVYFIMDAMGVVVNKTKTEVGDKLTFLGTQIDLRGQRFVLCPERRVRLLVKVRCALRSEQGWMQLSTLRSLVGSLLFASFTLEGSKAWLSQPLRTIAIALRKQEHRVRVDWVRKDLQWWQKALADEQGVRKRYHAPFWTARCHAAGRTPQVVMTASDASGKGAVAAIVNNGSQFQVAHHKFSASEYKRFTNSTAQELMGLAMVLSRFPDTFKGKLVTWISDSQAAVRCVCKMVSTNKSVALALRCVFTESRKIGAYVVAAWQRRSSAVIKVCDACSRVDTLAEAEAVVAKMAPMLLKSMPDP